MRVAGLAVSVFCVFKQTFALMALLLLFLALYPQVLLSAWPLCAWHGCVFFTGIPATPAICTRLDVPQRFMGQDFGTRMEGFGVRDRVFLEWDSGHGVSSQHCRWKRGTTVAGIVQMPS